LKVFFYQNLSFKNFLFKASTRNVMTHTLALVKNWRLLFWRARATSVFLSKIHYLKRFVSFDTLRTNLLFRKYLESFFNLFQPFNYLFSLNDFVLLHYLRMFAIKIHQTSAFLWPVSFHSNTWFNEFIEMWFFFLSSLSF
jgi:hypothetical protein